MGTPLGLFSGFPSFVELTAAAASSPLLGVLIFRAVILGVVASFRVDLALGGPGGGAAFAVNTGVGGTLGDGSLTWTGSGAFGASIGATGFIGTASFCVVDTGTSGSDVFSGVATASSDLGTFAEVSAPGIFDGSLTKGCCCDGVGISTLFSTGAGGSVIISCVPLAWGLWCNGCWMFCGGRFIGLFGQIGVE